MRRPVGWGARLVAFAAGTALVGYTAFAQAFVQVTQRNNPALSLRIDPGAPVALVRDASNRMSAGEKGFTAKRVEETVRESVRTLALNGPALELLSVIRSAGSSSPAEQRRILLLASRIDRHNLGQQLALIEEAVSRNDVADVLDRYDVAMRMGERSHPVLYPVLTRALEDPAIRRRFIPYLAAPPPWLPSFLRFAVSTSSKPEALAALAREAGGFPEGDAFSSLDTELLSRLVGAGENEEAIAHFRTITDADPGLLTNAAMTDASTQRSLAPVSWQIFELASLDALFLSTEGENMQVSARMGSLYAGPIVQKLFALPAGNYTLHARQGVNDPESRMTTRWRLDCVAGPADTLLDRSISVSRARSVQLAFEIPRGCSVQKLLVSANNGVSSGETELTIERTRISKSNR